MPIIFEKGSRVWDLPTRILHWLVAGLALGNLFFLESGEDPHRYAGYAAATLVAIRLLWSIWSTEEAKVYRFPLHPRHFRAFLTSPFPGHNPPASLVYILIWLSIFCLGLSGWLMGTDRFWGEEWLETLHKNFALGLQALLILHLMGITIDMVRYRRHTWLSMFTGSRRPFTR